MQQLYSFHRIDKNLEEASCSRFRILNSFFVFSDHRQTLAERAIPQMVYCVAYFARLWPEISGVDKEFERLVVAR